VLKIITRTPKSSMSYGSALANTPQRVCGRRLDAGNLDSQIRHRLCSIVARAIIDANSAWLDHVPVSITRRLTD
jgi:exonuclease III